MADKRHFIHNTDIGQNFLIDRGVVEFILKRSEPAAGDVVLEIGPGDGILTRGLLTTPLAALYSVEVETGCATALRGSPRTTGGTAASGAMRCGSITCANCRRCRQKSSRTCHTI
ncbi:MAG: rRNA adenine N-6-methyltransferase family protein [Cloacibacillus evryensis]